MKARLQRAAWFSLAGIAFFQLYVVRELLAVLLLLSVVFAAFAAVVFALNGLHAAYQFVFVKAEVLFREDFSRKPFRRLRSLTAR